MQPALYCKGFFMEEIRKDIIWYEWLYQISNMGNVKSLERTRPVRYWLRQTIKERILKPFISSKWYLGIILRRNYIWKTINIHRIVATHFIDNDFDKKTVNHKDWNKKNNKVDNLERMTHSENHIHAYKVLWRKSSSQWRVWRLSPVSIPIVQYNKSMEKIKVWENSYIAHKELWICMSSIYWCLKWRRKTGWWFIFKYLYPDTIKWAKK